MARPLDRRQRQESAKNLTHAAIAAEVARVADRGRVTHVGQVGRMPRRLKNKTNTRSIFSAENGSGTEKQSETNQITGVASIEQKEAC